MRNTLAALTAAALLALSVPAVAGTATNNYAPHGGPRMMHRGMMYHHRMMHHHGYMMHHHGYMMHHRGMMRHHRMHPAY